jgi:L-fuculose-phosphate aldolase
LSENNWSEEEARLRKGICEIGRLAYQRFHIVGGDGNISARMADGTILITPAGAMKGFLEPHQIAHIDMKGEPVDGGPGASTERGIHIVAYEVRPEMKAVVHAHPPHAVAMTIAGIDLQTPFIPEIIVTIGGIPTVPFGTPGTHELGDSIRDTLKCSDTVLMTHHGSVTLGANLLDAYKKLDMIEHTAKILYLAHSVGHARPLDPKNVGKLLETREKLGIETTNTLENNCGAPAQLRGERPELEW